MYRCLSKRFKGATEKKFFLLSIVPSDRSVRQIEHWPLLVWLRLKFWIFYPINGAISSWNECYSTVQCILLCQPDNLQLTSIIFSKKGKNSFFQKFIESVRQIDIWKSNVTSIANSALHLKVFWSNWWYLAFELSLVDYTVSRYFLWKRKVSIVRPTDCRI